MDLPTNQDGPRCNPQARELLDQGLAACRAQQVQHGLDLFSQSIAADPNSADLLHSIATIMIAAGASGPAETVLLAATRKFPDHIEAWNTLGSLYMQTGRPVDAMHVWRQALQQDPKSIAPRFNLAMVCERSGRLDEADALLRTLLEMQPDHAQAWMLHGYIQRDLGKLGDSIRAFEHAIELNPNDQRAHGALLFSLWFGDQMTRTQIVHRHHQWALTHADGLVRASPVSAGWQPDRTAERKLRIGYVSPFFHDHVISCLMEPVLAHHDPGQFDVFAYCNAPPGVTHEKRLRPLVSQWRNCNDLDDDALATQIREDRIDILVDLNLHMPAGRAFTFARKPAPVQINYLAYPATSGLSAMDYRVTCPLLDPPGSEEPAEPEKLLCLPHTIWCYPTCDDVPIRTDVPQKSTGHVTFGSLNSFVKVRDKCLEAWSTILTRVPGSRLTVLVQGGAGSRSILERMSHFGIHPARVRIVGHVDRRSHLHRFNDIDVCLDTFPYGGHVSTHDALWMGVPVIAMLGDTPVSRAGQCILSSVELSSLVARNRDHYVSLAIEWAGDTAARSKLRRELRARMLASPLSDPERFVRHLESGYRAAWKRWCAGLQPCHIAIEDS